ncbi:MAG: hypothetical protein IJS08_04340 [Victivallales bacterium]|nr:hypothetical protein [Victivallales bacterium]
MKEEEKKKRENDGFIPFLNAALAAEKTDRYGSAIKEHIVSYSGVDNENGTTLKRSLKDISKSKVNPDFEEQNLKQQAGFSAENKQVARENAEHIVAGDKTRVARSDDVGSVNDELRDIVELNSDGTAKTANAAQMKFVGSTDKQAAEKLLSEQFKKYPDNDVDFMVPSDRYDGIAKNLDDEIASWEKQVDHLEKNGGDKQVLEQKRERLERARNIRKGLKKSRVSTKDAMEARTNPGLSTAKDMAKLGNRAGLEQAKASAVTSGCVSLVSNMLSVIHGDKTAAEAGKDVLATVGESAASGYAVAFSGSVLKGYMQNAASESIRTLAKTNLPAYLATSVCEMSKTLIKFMKGDATAIECLEELGEKGTNMLSSAMGAAIGQMVIPIPVLGAIAGSMLGYALSSASYGTLLSSMKEAKYARERRIQIEKECNAAIELQRLYQQEIESYFTTYLNRQLALGESVFSDVDKAIQSNDIDSYVAGMNRITEEFGGKPLFKNKKEFDDLMNDSAPIIL